MANSSFQLARIPHPSAPESVLAPPEELTGHRLPDAQSLCLSNHEPLPTHHCFSNHESLPTNHCLYPTPPCLRHPPPIFLPHPLPPAPPSHAFLLPIGYSLFPAFTHPLIVSGPHPRMPFCETVEPSESITCSHSFTVSQSRNLVFVFLSQICRIDDVLTR
jgi:hypothetical protein